MQANDIVLVNVTGTNGTTRHQKTIARRFNGAGQALNDNGQVDVTAKEALRNLPSGVAANPPEFPMAEFNAASAAKDIARLKAIQLAYGTKLKEWEQAQGGGSEELQIAKSVLEYTKEFHGFRETDGDHFIMKLENLDVTKAPLPDGRTVYTVAGTAVFGA